MTKKAVLLLSGGVDSAVCLAWLMRQGFDVYALTFDYGQRNRFEIDAAATLAQQMGAIEHQIKQVDLTSWGGSALTDRQLEVPSVATDQVPVTYVPARNTIFLAMALAWAEVLGAQTLCYGANELDYVNYPDCRRAYIDAFQTMANLSTRAGSEGKKFDIITPLIQLDKPGIVQLGLDLGVDFSLTQTCYNPAADGAACQVCDACRFRAEAFAAIE